MDIICASICFRNYAEDEVEATLRLAPGFGYRLMEIHGPAVWNVEAVHSFDVLKIQRDLKAFGMQCAGIYSPGWGGRNAQEVQEHASAIATCVRFAETLGARHVTSTGASPRSEPGALDRLIECVRRVLEDIQQENPAASRARKTDVKLTLEPHLGNVLQNSDDFERVLEACDDPRVGVCLDTGHLHAAGVDIPVFVRRFRARLYAVHLKDHVGAESVGIGRGEIDLPAVIAALKEVSYRGGLTVELEVNDPENLPRYSHEAYVYLNGLLGQKL